MQGRWGRWRCSIAMQDLFENGGKEPRENERIICTEMIYPLLSRYVNHFVYGSAIFRKYSIVYTFFL